MNRLRIRFPRLDDLILHIEERLYRRGLRQRPWQPTPDEQAKLDAMSRRIAKAWRHNGMTTAEFLKRWRR